MSSFSRQHCPNCDDDTVHRFSVCLTCKTVRETPTARRQAAGKRIRRRMAYDTNFKRLVVKAAIAKREETKKRRVGFYDYRASAGVSFGKGRERTKL